MSTVVLISPQTSSPDTLARRILHDDTGTAVVIVDTTQ